MANESAFPTSALLLFDCQSVYLSHDLTLLTPYALARQSTLRQQPSTFQPPLVFKETASAVQGHPLRLSL